MAAWQSRKARDLLKLLVARRGHPMTREAAAEAMWPGEDPEPLGNRLSVALSTIRKVLDPRAVTRRTTTSSPTPGRSPSGSTMSTST